MKCYTDMRALLQAAAPQPEAAQCRTEPSEWFPPASDDGDGSVAAMARKAAPQPEAIQGLQAAHDVVTIELLNDRVMYLEGQLEAMRKDAEMLDFLDSTRRKHVVELGGRWYTRANYGMPIKERKNLRDAIDAALAAQGGV